MALTDNLVSYWKLDESSGNAADSVGSNTLTNNNSTAYVSGKINNGADLESTSSNYFSKATSVDLPSGNGARSISAWVKVESYPDHLTVLSYGTRNNYQNFEFIILSSGVMTVGIYNENSANSSTAISTGTWHHIAYTYDGTTSKFYLDGVIDGTDTFANTPNTGTSTNLYVGILNDATSFKFDGIIDELAVWSRALTEVEVGQLYNLTSGLQYPFTPEPSSLVAQIRGYWKLDESSGNAADSFGGRTLTNVNTTVYTTGKINNGADLEASSSNNLVYTTDSLSIGTGDSRSMSAWIKLESNPTSTNEYLIFVHGESLANFRVSIFNDGGTMKVNSVRNNAGFNNTSAYSVDLNDSNWHHIVQTASNSAGTWTIKTYIDSVERISHSSTFSTSSNTITGFKLGTLSLSDGVPQYFDGIIDEVGIWTRALTSTEITSLYNSGAGNQYPFSTIQNLVMAATTATFALTGIDTTLLKLKMLVADVASYILTGMDAILVQIGTHWTNESKNNSTWSNQSKNTSIWSNQIKY